MTRRRAEGSMARLRCTSCNGTASLLVLSGDTDMATDGLGTATSCSADRVALGEMTAKEWSDHEGGPAAFASRLRSLLDAPDLRGVRLLRAVKRTLAVSGESFAAFRESYLPNVLIYSCPCCEVGEAQIVATMSIEEFRTKGGEILTDGTVEI